MALILISFIFIMLFHHKFYYDSEYRNAHAQLNTICGLINENGV